MRLPFAGRSGGARRTVPGHTAGELCILVARCTPQASVVARVDARRRSSDRRRGAPPRGARARARRYRRAGRPAPAPAAAARVILASLTLPLALAAAGSVAATGFFDRGDRHLASLRDDRLEVRPAAVAGLESAVGTRLRDAGGGPSWRIAGRRVEGFATSSGRCCFRFVGLTGGCLAAGALSPAHPLDVMLDDGPGEFRVYGLAADEVVAVSAARARHDPSRGARAQRVLPRRSQLGSRHRFGGTLVARLRDGSERLHADTRRRRRPAPGDFPHCPASRRSGVRRPDGRRTRPGPAFWGRRAGRLVSPAADPPPLSSATGVSRA